MNDESGEGVEETGTVAAQAPATDVAFAKSPEAGVKSKSSKSLRRQVQESEVVARRLAGETVGAIAADMGISRSTVQRRVEKALSRYAQPTQAVRDIEMARLEALGAAHWTRATGGDTRATETYLHVLDRRTRISGLDRSRVEVSVEGEVHHQHSGTVGVVAAVQHLTTLSPLQVQAAVEEYAKQRTAPLAPAALEANSDIPQQAVSRMALRVREGANSNTSSDLGGAGDGQAGDGVAAE